jgi:hypothetical protein
MDRIVFLLGTVAATTTLAYLKILEMEDKMVTREEFDAAMDALALAVASEADEVRTVIASLEAKIAQLSEPADFSEELAKLNSISSALGDIVTPAPPADPEG